MVNRTAKIYRGPPYSRKSHVSLSKKAPPAKDIDDISIFTYDQLLLRTIFCSVGPHRTLSFDDVKKVT